MAAMDKTCEKLKDRLVSLSPLLKILECAVCLEVVKIPFKLCVRGHLICKECIKGLPHCPTCKGAFQLENPVCVKNLIEALPKPCRHAGNGCEEVVEPNDNSDHERFCKFRSVECYNCWNETPMFKLGEHLKQNHLSNVLRTLEMSRISLKSFQPPNNFNCLLFIGGHFFWLRLKNAQGNVEIKFHANFVSKPTDDYFVKLTFEKDSIGFTLTLKALDVSGDSESEDEDGISSTIMFFKSFKRFINSEGNLHFDYNVFKKPKA